MYKLKDSRGFTLIEIVLALGILTIGIVSILSLFPVGLDSGRKAMDYTDASLLVSYKMADIIYNLDDSISNPTYPVHFPKTGDDPAPFNTNIKRIDDNFLWSYDVNENPLDTTGSLFRIDLSIYSIADSSTPITTVTTFIRTKES